MFDRLFFFRLKFLLAYKKEFICTRLRLPLLFVEWNESIKYLKGRGSRSWITINLEVNGSNDGRKATYLLLKTSAINPLIMCLICSRILLVMGCMLVMPS